MTFNQIHVVGYLGRDPDLRYTPNGLVVANFSVATTEKRKEHGETQEHTTWFRVTVWGRQAEIAQEYLSKGSLVHVTGSIRLNEFTDREGMTRVTLECNAQSFHMLGGRGDGQGGDRSRSASASGGSNINERMDDLGDPEDIPF